MTEIAATGNTALITGTRALVSGATGFLGGHLAQVLHGLGYRVRILVHKRQRIEHLLALGMEIVEGDLLDPASLLRATAGQSVVFHTAGKVTDWGPRAEYFQVNTEGTRNVVAACRENGVGRLVHVSSLSVLGLPRRGDVVTEETPYPRSLPDPYSASKKAAEQLVRAANREGGLATTVVRPGVIWGPGDITIVPRLVDLLRRGQMILIDGGRNLLGLSHIESLARGLALAAVSPRAAGQIYHMTDGEEITAREAVDALAAVVGAPRARLSLPYGAVYGIAALVEGAALLAGRTTPPSMTRYGVRLVACHCRYDIGKARRELGYEPAVTFREGIKNLAF
ncbi:MAG: NAD-dependent epimerase/dehydratase family protein [Candidatus Methylomirabilia bacterium]